MFNKHVFSIFNIILKNYLIMLIYMSNDSVSDALSIDAVRFIISQIFSTKLKSHFSHKKSLSEDRMFI